MSNCCYFRKPEPIGVDIIVTKSVIIQKALNILNKVAESQYDGQNAQFVNNLQPEVDFTQDEALINDYYEDGIMRIMKRIEPYVIGCDENTSGTEPTVEVTGHTLHLQFPENWKRQFESVLRKRVEDYMVYMVIAHWVEKVGEQGPRRRYMVFNSLANSQYAMDISDELLYELRHTCDMRQGAVHKGWNTTY